MSAAWMAFCLIIRLVVAFTLLYSASFLAEISVRSPRTLFIFIIYKKLSWIKISKKTFYLFLKTEALAPVQTVRLAVTGLTGSVFI